MFRQYFGSAPNMIFQMSSTDYKDSCSNNFKYCVVWECKSWSLLICDSNVNWFFSFRLVWLNSKINEITIILHNKCYKVSIFPSSDTEDFKSKSPPSKLPPKIWISTFCHRAPNEISIHRFPATKQIDTLWNQINGKFVSSSFSTPIFLVLL